MSAAAPRPPQQAAAARTPVVALQDAGVVLGGRAVWSEVTLELVPGELTAVLGPNGAGKTTLLRVLLGELPLAAGRASVLGAAPGRANRRIGYLPQRRQFDAGMRIRGIDLVRLGLDGARWGLPLRRLDPGPVNEVLELVGARAYAHSPIGQLSGGEQQRLLIAQALVSQPELLMLDEPLDSLDLPNQRAVAGLLADICHHRGVAALLVAHDINPLLSHLDRVVYFGAGGAAIGTPTDVITSETLSRLYGVPVEVLRSAAGRRVVVGLPEPPAHHSDRHHGHPHDA